MPTLHLQHGASERCQVLHGWLVAALLQLYCVHDSLTRILASCPVAAPADDQGLQAAVVATARDLGAVAVAAVGAAGPGDVACPVHGVGFAVDAG